MQDFAGNSKPIYEVYDSKIEKSPPMYCIEWTPLRCIAYAFGIDQPDSINLEKPTGKS